MESPFQGIRVTRLEVNRFRYEVNQFRYNLNLFVFTSHTLFQRQTTPS